MTDRLGMALVVRTEERACPACGTTFEARVYEHHAGRRYCTDRCRNRARQRRHVRPPRPAASRPAPSPRGRPCAGQRPGCRGTADRKSASGLCRPCYRDARRHPAIACERCGGAFVLDGRRLLHCPSCVAARAADLAAWAEERRAALKLSWMGLARALGLKDEDSVRPWFKARGAGATLRPARGIPDHHLPRLVAILGPLPVETAVDVPGPVVDPGDWDDTPRPGRKPKLPRVLTEEMRQARKAREAAWAAQRQRARLAAIAGKAGCLLCGGELWLSRADLLTMRGAPSCVRCRSRMFVVPEVAA
jgi:hypothetical protein